MFFKLKNHKYTVLFFSPSACDSVRLETKNKTNTKQPFLSVRLLDKHRLNSQSSSLDVPFSKQRWLQAVLNIVVYTISLHYINPVIRQCFATCQPCIIIQLNMFKNTLCQKNTCHLSVLQSKHRHSASLKKESSSSFLLIILTQLSDKVDRRLAPMMNEGHDIRRPVGRYNVSKNWRSTALLNRALEAFQFMLAGDFQRGGQVVDSCAFWLH